MYDGSGIFEFFFHFDFFNINKEEFVDKLLWLVLQKRTVGEVMTAVCSFTLLVSLILIRRNLLTSSCGWSNSPFVQIINILPM